MPPRRARTKTTVGMASVPSDGALPISLHGARRRKTVGRVVQNQHPIRATGWRGEAQPIPLLDDADRTGNACARIIPVAGQMLSREPGEIQLERPAGGQIDQCISAFTIARGLHMMGSAP